MTPSIGQAKTKFGINKLKRRIEALERDYRKRLCESGVHE